MATLCLQQRGVLRSSCEVPHTFAPQKKNWNLQKDIHRSPQYQISRKPSRGRLAYTCGATDRQTERCTDGRTDGGKDGYDKSNRLYPFSRDYVYVKNVC